VGHPGKLLPRIACLQVPELPLCALLRARPDLHDRPLAVTEGPGRAARVFAATEEAEAVRPGMTAAQAQTVCPELELYPADPELVRQAHAALLDLAHAFSPRVESGPAGLAYLEATGLFPVFGPEANLVARIQEAAGRLDLGMRVGLASGKGVARTAAQEADATGGRVIPPGQEAEYFSLYEISDKGTSWLGPMFYGLALQFTGSYRISIVLLIVFFLIGLAILTKVDVKRGAIAAGNEPPVTG